MFLDVQKCYENLKKWQCYGKLWQCLAMFGKVCYNEFEGKIMKINELYSDILLENTKYEFKAILNSDKLVKWAKSIY